MKAVVTGGGGFVGSAVARALLARGDEVAILSRSRHPEVEAQGARGIAADLSRADGLAEHVCGADVVFHVAARAGVSGPREAFLSANVEGTRNLLAACREAGVRRFVHTSSPSVTFDGHDACGLTEADCRYPDRFEAPYPESKAQAERLVLAANSAEFATTVLRPHLVYGPGDPHIVPRLIARRRQGRLARVGDGANRVAITYVDNAAAAHVLAGDRLGPGSPNAGRAYFVTDSPPVVLWEWIDALLVGVGEKPVDRRVSRGAARAVGGVLEAAWRLFRLEGEPPMTRFVAAELAASHWYDLSAAKADFGYEPVVDGPEGLRRTVEAFRGWGGASGS